MTLEEMMTRLNAQRYKRPEHKPDKGHWRGSCNREACQKPGAALWNTGTQAYYCEECATAIHAACADYVAQHGPILVTTAHEAHPHHSD